MPDIMLAAEADQIQDFIFRASRLREVVGGSQFLTRFCAEGARSLLYHHGGDPQHDLIVNDGGSFRVRFGDQQKAIDFGRDLAELYRRMTGCNLTVAKPVDWSDDFAETSQRAQSALREAKSHGDVAAATAHLPFMAFCASCGVALATDRYAHHRNRPQTYYCASCRQKDIERSAEVGSLRRQPTEGGFLGSFLKAVRTACESSDEITVPSRFPQDAEDVGAFDLTGRRYVAYLLADGNGMGTVFGDCRDESTLKELSKALPQALRESLAEACPLLLDQVSVNHPNPPLPMLPLILGGDDLFALLPASWALDITARFCRAYERRLKATLEQLDLRVTAASEPTIAAAVVICKATYPHALAHRQGERLLQQSKRLARGLEVEREPNRRMSTLSIGLITGNEVGAPAEVAPSGVRLSMSPYFVSPSLPLELNNVSHPVAQLHHHRQRLEAHGLPGKRRAELEQVFADASVLLCQQEGVRSITDGCNVLLDRIGLRSTDLRQVLHDALVDLGGVNYVDDVQRPYDERVCGSAMSDLLHFWHYLHALDTAVDADGE